MGYGYYEDGTGPYYATRDYVYNSEYNTYVLGAHLKDVYLIQCLLCLGIRYRVLDDERRKLKFWADLSL